MRPEPCDNARSMSAAAHRAVAVGAPFGRRGDFKAHAFAQARARDDIGHMNRSLGKTGNGLYYPRMLRVSATSPPRSWPISFLEFSSVSLPAPSKASPAGPIITSG